MILVMLGYWSCWKTEVAHDHSPLQVDMEMSEEEQIMRAIALSLGNNMKKEEEEEEKKEEPKKEEEKDQLSPVNKLHLDEFSDTLLPGCIELASSVSDSVYRVCDLLSALAKRNGKEWRSRALERVRNKVSCGGVVAGGVVAGRVAGVWVQIHVCIMLHRFCCR